MTDSSPRAPASVRLLIAEDEPHLRRILLTLFESSGFGMDVFSDGSSALAAVRGEVPYDVMLLDIMMPGTTGLEILRELRTLEHRATTPVIVLTAKGQDVDREEAFALGANAFVTKPFSPKKLLSHVDELLARR
jgi:DNA-binding response OmpR family regulator